MKFKLRWRILADEGAATMVEYAIMAVFIAAVCAGIIAVVGQDVLRLFSSVPPF